MNDKVGYITVSAKEYGLICVGLKAAVSAYEIYAKRDPFSTTHLKDLKKYTQLTKIPLANYPEIIVSIGAK